MKNKYNVDEEALFCVTGDPFTDAAAYALKELSAKFPEKDILQLLSLATDIYVDNWNAKINPFFLNSKITQPAFNAKRKKEETVSYFRSMIYGEMPSRKGYCRITGRYADLYPAGRDNTVLSGSGKFVNFHHAFEPGAMLTKEALIRYHFLPLACGYVEDKIAVISSSSSNIAETYARKCCSEILAEVAQGQSSGILRNRAQSPGTAIFLFLDSVCSEYKEESKGEAISLYHFTNFGANPDIQIYTVPSAVFAFYRICRNAVYKTGWQNFVSGFYRSKDYKDAKYDSSSLKFVLKKNKVGEITIPIEEYKYWRNGIYDKLMKGLSLLGDILTYSKKSKFNLDLLKVYLLKIRNMKEETVDKVFQITDFIMEAYGADYEIGKIIKTLNEIKSAYMLRRFIIKKVVEKNYKSGNGIILSVKDCVDYLFPDAGSWKEIRDILLIAIYQRLHETQTKVKIDDSDDSDIFGDDVE